VLATGGTYAPASWTDIADVPDDFGYAPPIPITDDGRIRFVGTADQLANDVQDYLAAGVEHFTLRFSAGGHDTTVADYLDQLTRFAKDVMARFAEPLTPDA
jgi:hypothetical protein